MATPQSRRTAAGRLATLFLMEETGRVGVAEAGWR